MEFFNILTFLLQHKRSVPCTCLQTKRSWLRAHFAVICLHVYKSCDIIIPTDLIKFDGNRYKQIKLTHPRFRVYMYDEFLFTRVLNITAYFNVQLYPRC